MRFQGGGVGTLTHGVTLQGQKYETAIEVWADGLRMSLEEPYFPECRLRVRLGEQLASRLAILVPANVANLIIEQPICHCVSVCLSATPQVTLMRSRWRASPMLTPTSGRCRSSWPPSAPGTPVRSAPPTEMLPRATSSPGPSAGPASRTEVFEL